MNANSFVISVDGNFDRRTKFILEDTNNVLRDTTTNTAGKLLYDNVLLQNQLTTYSENSASNTYYINTDEPNGVFLSGWGSWTNYTGYQRVPTGVHIGLLNLPTSGQLTFSFQLRGVGSKTDLVLTINNSQTYTGYQEIKFTGLNSTFQTFTWTVNAYSTGIFNLHTYPSPTGSTLTQAAGSDNYMFLGRRLLLLIQTHSDVPASWQ